MKKLLVAATSVLLLAGISAPAGAIPSGKSPTSPAGAGVGKESTAMAATDAQREQALEKHITKLHTKLQITTAQENLWAAVVQSMRDSEALTDKAVDKREAMVGDGTAVDNLRSYGDIAQAHADGVKKLATAFAPLYAAMPREQQKVADAVFAHREPHDKHATK